MENRKSSHTTTTLMVHIVWITKYRYKVLKGDVKKRCHELLVQICESMDIRIMGGVVSIDHIHMHLEYSPSLSVSDIVKRLKGRTSRLLQSEFPNLKRTYWGKHFWGIGYGAWTTGNVTEEMVQEYLKNHNKRMSENGKNLKYGEPQDFQS
jgi:putative transposase